MLLGEEEKSHVRYPARYPTIRNAEETAEYQYTRGVPLAPQAGFPVTSGSPFFISKSKIQTSIPIPPVTGENRTQPSTSQSKNLHRVEESSHQQASQHPKTSSHWRKLDATKHLTVQIPPVTGTYDPLRHLQSPYYSSAWKNHPAERPLQKDVSGGACVTA